MLEKKQSCVLLILQPRSVSDLVVHSFFFTSPQSLYQQLKENEKEEKSKIKKPKLP